MYVRRDENGRIEAVSRREGEGFEEFLDPESPELAGFVNGGVGNGVRGRLAATDLELVRVLEDLIDLLVDKEVIRFTDLPAAAQKKLMARRDTRVTLRKGLDLLGDEDERPPV